MTPLPTTMQKTFWLRSRKGSQYHDDAKWIYKAVDTSADIMGNEVALTTEKGFDPELIPREINVSEKSIQFDWNDRIRYTHHKQTSGYSLPQVSIEWCEPNSPYLRNHNGPACVTFYENKINIRYVTEQGANPSVTRESLKAAYEVAHLEVVDENNKKARLLADDATDDNLDFWYKWLDSLEEERGIDSWMNALNYNKTEKVKLSYDT